MQVTYDGAHSLLIGDFVNSEYKRSGFLHTWEDLHLIPTTAPSIDPPPIKENYVDIPGANGSIDMNEILVGRPLYENRTGSIEFYIDSTDEEYADGGEYRWDYAYDKLLNALHGFRQKVILTDARSSYYEGRVSVNSFKSDKLTGVITLDYNLEPFKMAMFSTTENWLWNPFDFVKGVIVDQKKFRYVLTQGYSGPIVINNDITGVAPVIPTIKAVTDRPIDFNKTNAAGGSGFGIAPDGQDPRLWCLFKATDIIDQYNCIVEIKNPVTSNGTVITVGDPRKDYVFNFEYLNNFRDSDNNPIRATFYLDFRPRRL